MNYSFNAYELNPDIQDTIHEVVKEPDVAGFIEWLLNWEGGRLNYTRVPSLDDVVQSIDKLSEDRR